VAFILVDGGIYVQGDTGLGAACNVIMVLGVVCKVTLGWELCAM
jgi:hypothetical protein